MAKEKEKKETLSEEDMFPKEKIGIRHLIECNCILPQYRHRKVKIWHKFPVFSIIDENNNVIPKFAQCNNCNIIHKIIEINKSEISVRDNMSSLRTIDDIKIGISEQFAGLLEQHKCDISVWEQLEFIIENERWEEFVILSKEEEPNNLSIFGKILIVKGPTLAKVESFEREHSI